MLSQFTVGNHKSIRDEITLDLQATSISEHEDRLIKSGTGEMVLPVSAIYGPNGGGKSNVLQALYVLQLKILYPVFAASDGGAQVARVKMSPFAFSSEHRSLPTDFTVFFYTKRAEYKYMLSVKDETVTYEMLARIRFDTKRKSLLYTREGNNIEIKNDLGRIKVTKDISATLPFLSYLGIMYRSNEVVDDVIGWFESGIEFLNYGDPMVEFLNTARIMTGDEKTLMLNMIKEMDLGIDDYHIVTSGERTEVYTRHVGEGFDTDLSLLQESSGTIKLFSLLPHITHSLLHGTTLIIDELDAKIHPLLLEYLIRLFSDINKNKKGAQLIFTSHDLSTMNSELFRRDEIWFVAKGSEQNSQLYSLVEFKQENGKSVRKDAKFDKQYLEGKYGADPYLRKIIQWEVINA